MKSEEEVAEFVKKRNQREMEYLDGFIEDN